MPTSPCLAVRFATHAIIEWESDTMKHILAKPDPKASSITLMAHFNSTNAIFELYVPIKLKGLNNTFNITLRACASPITSLVLVKNPTVTTEVK
ncbi:hypothetical protein FAVG1_08528 [Fusarium avenaceum]|nr:hypothetical protein FAVG1_08528 [Fusarium avenaceum]